MMKYVISCVLITAFLGMNAQSQTHVLTVEIEEVVSGKGLLKVAVYDSEDHFMDVSKAVRTAVIDLEAEKRTHLEFGDLPTGKYAVAVMQDIDKNGELNMGAYGPTEPYGFSNNARGTSGPPHFEACVFPLKKDRSLSIAISPH